ncbi:5964_t:CDS:2 [Acaulospora morrowiae]|uniref:5964_t:CDS:1 n=1 Tax=Acaulospora morrowiae TaxID=94023 RepID=A0A9N8VD14_9GLOM|nr:5964_t:CDS:2 [Acaulospora morrowiae]
MEVVKIDIIFEACLQVLKKVIRDLHISLEVNINNNSTLLLCERQLFTVSDIKKSMANNVDPSKTDTAKISGRLVSRGILSYKVKEKKSFHYLVITWAVKTKLEKGKNSITVTTTNKKPERESKDELYNDLHKKKNRKYAGDYIDVNDQSYRISGDINDG